MRADIKINPTVENLRLSKFVYGKINKVSVKKKVSVGDMMGTPEFWISKQRNKSK